QIDGRHLGCAVLLRHRLGLEVLGAGEERGVRIRDALLAAPVLGDDAEIRGCHHRQEEEDHHERKHADHVLAQAPPGEGPEAGRFLERGGGRIGEDGAHLKLTLGSTNLYITSTIRLISMVRMARYTVTALMTGKSLRLTAVMISRPNPGIEKNTSSRNEPTKMPGSEMPMLVRIGIRALRMTCFNITRFSGRPLARAVRT